MFSEYIGYTNAYINPYCFIKCLEATTTYLVQPTGDALSAHTDSGKMVFIRGNAQGMAV